MEILIKIIVVLLTAGILILLFKYLTKDKAIEIGNASIRTIKKQKFLLIQILVVIVVCSIALIMTNTITETVGKDSYINDFEDFVGEVKNDYEEYSKSEWKDIEKEYLDFSEKKRLVYEELLSKEDKKRLSRLEGEYRSYRTSGFIDNIMTTTKDAFNNTVEYIDGFMQVKKTESQDIIDEIIADDFNNDLVNDTINLNDTIYE